MRAFPLKSPVRRERHGSNVVFDLTRKQKGRTPAAGRYTLTISTTASGTHDDARRALARLFWPPFRVP
jgi:hypothetical protein